MSTTGRTGASDVDHGDVPDTVQLSHTIPKIYRHVLKQWKSWISTLNKSLAGRGQSIADLERSKVFFENGLSVLITWAFDVSIEEPGCIAELNKTILGLAIETTLEDLSYLLDNCALNERLQVVVSNMGENAQDSEQPLSGGASATSTQVQSGILVGNAAQTEFEEVLSALREYAPSVRSSQALSKCSRPNNAATSHVTAVEIVCNTNPSFRYQKVLEASDKLQALDSIVFSQFDASTPTWFQYAQGISASEIEKFAEGTKQTFREYEDAIRQAYRRRKKEQPASQIIRFVDALIKALHKYNPEAPSGSRGRLSPANMIPGSIVWILEKSSHFIPIQSTITTMLKRVGSNIAQLTGFDKETCQSNDAVKQSLTEVYCHVLNLTRSALDFLVAGDGRVRAGPETVGMSEWEEFGLHLDGRAIQIENGLRAFSMEAKLAKRKLETSRTLSETQSRNLNPGRNQLIVDTSDMPTVIASPHKVDLDTEPVGRIQTTSNANDPHQSSQLLRFLASTSFYDTHVEKSAICIEGTARWLLSNKAYQDWKLGRHHSLTGPQQVSNLLWVQGGPGTGKSVLAASAIADLELEMAPNVAVAYIYCNAFYAEAADAYVLASSILKQLCLQTPRVADAMSEVFRDSNVVDGSETQLSWVQLTRAMQRLARRFINTFVIVDGIDECTEPIRLVTVVADLAKTRIDGLGILLFSRRLGDYVESILEGADTLMLSPQLNFEDLKAFISNEVQKARLSARFGSAFADLVTDRVLEMCRGSFITAQSVIEGVKNASSEATAVAILEAVPDLSDVYERCLHAILNRSDAKTRPLAKLLLWTTNARRPLSLEEMLEALSFTSWPAKSTDHLQLTKEDLSKMIEDCSDLIMLDEENRIRLTHASLKDFLTSSELTKHPGIKRYQIMQENVSEILASSCVAFLLEGSFWETATSHDYHAKMSRLLVDRPFLAYATANWGFHALASNAVSLQPDILKLIHNERTRNLCMQQIRTQEGYEPQIYRGNSHPLHLAAVLNLVDIAKKISDCPAHFFGKDSAGQFPFTYAMAEGHETMALWLLSLVTKQDLIEKGFPPHLLHLAATYGWCDVIRRLVELGFSCDSRDSIGRTPLMVAALRGHTESVRALREVGADIQLQDDDGDTALSYAAAGGQQETTALLINFGGLVSHQSGQGTAPLHLACAGDNVQIVCLLLNAGADLNMRESESGMTTMHHAALSTNAEIAQILFERGFTAINDQMKDGATPLHLAAANGNLASGRKLCELGADVHMRDNYGATPLYEAINSDHADFATVLFNNGAIADICNLNGDTPLHLAVRKNAAWVELILAAEVKTVNRLNKRPTSPLMDALVQEDVASVRILLEYGADVTQRGLVGASALHFAAHLGHEHLINDLLKFGADPAATDDDGDIPLHYAARTSNFGFISKLAAVTGPLDIDARNSSGRTALHVAAQVGSLDTVETLLSLSAVSTPDIDGNLPLHLAAWAGHNSVARRLYTSADAVKAGYLGRTPVFASISTGNVELTSIMIDSSESLNIHDDKGVYPIISAAFNGHMDIVNLLLDRGADANVRDISGNHLFHGAALGGDINLVKRLLELSCDPNVQNKALETPLLNAVQSLDLGKVDKILHAAPSTINQQNKWGETPVHMAAKAGDLEIFLRLVKSGGDPRILDLRGRNALQIAAGQGHLGIISWLLTEGTKDLSRSVDTVNAIGEAASSRCHSCVQKLLLAASTEDIDLVSKYTGRTPLIAATMTRAPLTVRQLLLAGADPTIRDLRGRTAAEYALCHQPTWREFSDCGMSSSSLGYREKVESAYLQASKLMQAIPRIQRNALPLLQFNRVCIISALFCLVHELNDATLRSLATPLMYELFYPTEDANYTAAGNCAVCNRGTVDEKYICTTCEDTWLCSSCHNDYFSAAEPMSAPESFRVLDRLEKELSSFRLAAYHHAASLVHLAVAISRTPSLEEWFDEKVADYKTWQLDHNSHGDYSSTDRPGEQFVTLIKETVDVLQVESSLNEIDDSIRGTLTKLQKKYEKTLLAHRPDQEYQDWVCQGHSFQHLSAKQHQAYKLEGDLMDGDGYVKDKCLDMIIPAMQTLKETIETANTEIQPGTSQQVLSSGPKPRLHTTIIPGDSNPTDASDTNHLLLESPTELENPLTAKVEDSFLGSDRFDDGINDRGKSLGTSKVQRQSRTFTVPPISSKSQVIRAEPSNVDSPASKPPLRSETWPLASKEHQRLVSRVGYKQELIRQLGMSSVNKASLCEAQFGGALILYDESEFDLDIFVLRSRLLEVLDPGATVVMFKIIAAKPPSGLVVRLIDLPQEAKTAGFTLGVYLALDSSNYSSESNQLSSPDALSRPSSPQDPEVGGS